MAELQGENLNNPTETDLGFLWSQVFYSSSDSMRFRFIHLFNKHLRVPAVCMPASVLVAKAKSVNNMV